MRELAEEAPLRFVLSEAMRFAGAIAIAMLVVQVAMGPLPARRPLLELAVLLGGGLLEGVVLLLLARRSPPQAGTVAS